MSPFPPRTTRLPRPGLDPIDQEATALVLLDAAATWPRRHETIVVLLDDARRGIGLVVVRDTADPDAVIEVAERILDPVVHDGRVAAVVVASIRPPDREHHDDLADAERWHDLDEVAGGCGVELVEWFVVGDGVSRPRELVNEPQRW